MQIAGGLWESLWGTRGRRGQSSDRPPGPAAAGPTAARAVGTLGTLRLCQLPVATGDEGEGTHGETQLRRPCHVQEGNQLTYPEQLRTLASSMCFPLIISPIWLKVGLEEY